MTNVVKDLVRDILAVRLASKRVRVGVLLAMSLALLDHFDMTSLALEGSPVALFGEFCTELARGAPFAPAGFSFECRLVRRPLQCVAEHSLTQTAESKESEEN